MAGMMKKLQRAVLMILAAQTLLAPAGYGADGVVYSFLRNDYSARAAALAGSVITVQDDPTSIFYNPAGVATLTRDRGSAGFFKHLSDINAGFLTYSTSFEGIGRFGAGLQYTNYGAFEETDALGNVLGSFSANDIAFTVGYGYALEENLFVGGAVKFVYSGIASYTSTGVAGDLGILYTLPASRFAIGMSIRNLGAQISTYNGIRESLPLDMSIGASIVPKGLPLLLNVGFHRLNEQTGEFSDRFRSFTVGGEFTLSKVLLFRFGYDNAKRRDFRIGSSADLAGFSAGIGILVSGYSVDYSMSSLGKAGLLHRISVSTAF
jgi:hypothetical protein